MTTPIRRRLRVRGVVQGVWFRASARDAARTAGATGWARNVADGSVEVEVQGDPAAVAAVERFCRSGPPLAEVIAVEASDIPLLADEEGFRTW